MIKKQVKSKYGFLSVRKKGSDIQVSYEERSIKLRSESVFGNSNVKILYSAICGSDGSRSGYYHGGRFEADLEDKDKLIENIKLSRESGIEAKDVEIEELLRIPNHEGWGEVVKTNPNK